VSSTQSELPSRVSNDQGRDGRDVGLVPPEIAIRRSLGLYSTESPGIRSFVWARHVLCPLAPIAAEIPPKGRVMDVGCGHGLFANALALGSAARTVLGIDPSAAKIDVARRSAARLPNVTYSRGLVQELDGGPFDAISILDVLYLLPVEEKLAVLRACRERIADAGVLVVKTNDTRPAWKYAVARLQEQLMTTVGLTMGHGLYFLSREQNAALLELAGFKPRTVVLESWLPYPHVMFVSRPA
jgi:2-polyprenyl-3-methyl-5-hydroxy-6-metoxy-1,4-benzoquinol methylase